MAIYRVQGADGEIHRFEGPDNATPQEVEAAAAQIFEAPRETSQPAAQQKPQERSVGDSFLRQFGLTARDAIGGLAAIPNMVADPAVHGINAALRAVLPDYQLPIPSEALERTMTRAGLPEPSSGTERFSQAVVGGMMQPALLAEAAAASAPGVIRSATALRQVPAPGGIPYAISNMPARGTLASIGPNASAMESNIGAQIGAAGGGAGGSDIAKEAGAGPIGQMLAGLGAGIAAPAALAATGTAARAGGRFLGNLVAPVTDAGRRDIAAGVLQRSATDPALAAQNIATAPRYVPGVNPTTAELANDTGLSALSKNVRNQSPDVFADIEKANDAVRQAALSRSLGTETDLQMAQQLRDDVTRPLREAAFAEAKPVNTRPIISSATAITNSGAGARQEVEKAMAWVKDRLHGETNPERIYGVRQDINDIIAGKMRDPEKASFQLAAGQLKAVRDVLDQQLEKSAPGFTNYLRQYADRSRTIDAMATGQDIVSRALNPMTERLSPAAFARQFSNRGQDVAKMGAIGSDVLSRVNADLKRSVAPTAAMRTPGSDTLQNMVGSDMLRGMLGHLPGGAATRVASKLASVVYSPFEQQTKALLTQSMVDPKLASDLLARELKKNPDLTRQLLGLRYPISYGGLLGTMSAQ